MEEVMLGERVDAASGNAQPSSGPVVVPANDGSTLLALQMLNDRLVKLENEEQHSLLKRISENASAVALFLGLVLTAASLYDVFVAKPSAERIDALSKFNQAVNSTAEIRQEVIQAQLQTTDPTLQMAVVSAATPRILNDISTARAILRTLPGEDVGIPQLLVLISESLTAGDLISANEFVSRAVSKTDTTPYLRSEALRYQGRLLFLTGAPEPARQAFEQGFQQLGSLPSSLGAKAYLISDLVLAEFMLGECAQVPMELERFLALLDGTGIPANVRRQLTSNMVAQLTQMKDQHCPMPQNFARLQVL